MKSNTQSYEPEAEQVDLAIQLYQLWDNKWLILIITALSLSLSMVYVSRKTPQYQSNVLLQIDSAKPGNVAQQQLLLGSLSSDSVATQIALIKSSYILDPVINSLKLNLSVSPKPRSIWERFFSSSGSNKIRFSFFNVSRIFLNKPLRLRLDSPEHVSLYDVDNHLLLQGNVGALLTTPDQHIRFKVTSVEAPVGAEFTLVKQSNAQVMQSLLTRLVVEEAGVKGSFAAPTGLLSLSFRGDEPTMVVRILNSIARTTQTQSLQKKAQEASQTLDFLYKQLPLTKVLLEKAESSLNQYRVKSGKIDITLQTQLLLNQLADLEKQQGALRIDKIKMLQQYTSSHPTMIALNAEIKILQVQQDELQRELSKLPASDQVAVNLMRDVKVKEALYLLLLNKIQELQVVKAGTVSAVQSISVATLPDAPLPVKKEMIYSVAIVLGLLVSSGFLFGRKIISPRVEDPNWSERHFNLPSLAVVPYCREQGFSTKGVQTKLLKQVPLMAHVNPKNLAVESIRSLRTSLQISLTCAKNNVLAIVGVTPGVGKTFISANIAYLLAAGGKRVILIDGDLRRGTMHKYFAVNSGPGLAEVLSHNALLNDALRPSSHENLTVLPRGAYPSNPSELLMSERFKDLMNTFSQQYDVVVIDTPPVLLVTDAVIIAGCAATTYLVVGAGAHQPSEIEIVLKRLSGAGVQVQGSIFNFYRAARKSGGYYGKYYNHSHYYDESQKT